MDFKVGTLLLDYSAYLPILCFMPFAPLISSTHRITLVTAHPNRMDWVVSTLQADGLDVAIDTNGNNVQNWVPDLVIFAVQDASRTERDMLHAIKAHPLTAPVPVVFLYADAEVAQLWSVLQGAIARISKLSLYLP